MADIAKTDVTYAEVAGQKYLSGMPPRYLNTLDLSFGNNTLTYPTGGVPLVAGSLGMPQGIVEAIEVLDPGTNAKGFKIEVDLTNLKLRFMVEDTVGTNTPLKEHTNATFVPNPAKVRVQVRGY